MYCQAHIFARPRHAKKFLGSESVRPSQDFHKEEVPDSASQHHDFLLLLCCSWYPGTEVPRYVCTSNECNLLQHCSTVQYNMIRVPVFATVPGTRYSYLYKSSTGTVRVQYFSTRIGSSAQRLNFQLPSGRETITVPSHCASPENTKATTHPSDPTKKYSRQ